MVTLPTNHKNHLHLDTICTEFGIYYINTNSKKKSSDSKFFLLPTMPTVNTEIQSRSTLYFRKEFVVFIFIELHTLPTLLTLPTEKNLKKIERLSNFSVAHATHATHGNSKLKYFIFSKRICSFHIFWVAHATHATHATHRNSKLKKNRETFKFQCCPCYSRYPRKFKVEVLYIFEKNL